MSEAWTPLGVLEWTTARFAEAQIASSRLDAQVLLAHVLQCDRIALYTHFDKPLGAEELAAYRGLIKRRLNGEPVAYLVGTREFYSRDFDVDPRVLIPRPDTEILVEKAISFLKAKTSPSLVDIATGTGAVAITLALEVPEAKVVASDLSEDALKVAASNAKKHDVSDTIDFRQGNMLHALASSETFDLIVSNPPYIREADIEKLSQEVQSEPRAL